MPKPKAQSPKPVCIADIVGEREPITVAAFMDLALYHPEFGYYARAAQRSGRAGDFFTSVDVGPLFGELLSVQLAEMFDLVSAGQAESERRHSHARTFALCYVGAKILKHGLELVPFDASLNRIRNTAASVLSCLLT